jgi:hypothetical protein
MTGAYRVNARRADALMPGAADWLSLAAAPIFAMMALLTGVLGGGPPDTLCSAAQDASPLSGMALMYGLMSIVHLAPWLRLLSCRRNVSDEPPRQDAPRSALSDPLKPRVLV